MPNTNTDITYLATADIVKTAGNLKLKSDDLITLWLPAAKQDVIKLIGEAKYEELSKLEDTDINKKLAALGEANYCLAYMMPGLNNATSGNGITKSSGVGEGKVELLSENDIDNKVTKYRNEAIRILSGFVTKADPDAENNPTVLNAGPLKFATP